MGTDEGIFISSDEGSTWTPTNSMLSYMINSVIVNGNNIFAGTDGHGVFFSSDNGNTWVDENYGLANNEVWSLAISGNYIFAGTSGSGVWKLPLSQVGIKEVTNNKIDVSVYPNPFIDFVNVKIANETEKADVVLSDIAGRVIYEAISNDLTINTSALPHGVYFLKTSNLKNEYAVTKIVK